MFKWAKEERSKCLSEDRRANRKSKGNSVLRHGRETLEKSTSEVMKERDSNNNCEEYIYSVNMLNSGN